MFLGVSDSKRISFSGLLLALKFYFSSVAGASLPSFMLFFVLSPLLLLCAKGCYFAWGFLKIVVADAVFFCFVFLADSFFARSALRGVKRLVLDDDDDDLPIKRVQTS